MPKVWFDLETRSPIPIRDGASRYAEEAEVILFAYALDDGPVKVWEALDTLAPERYEIEALLAEDHEWWGHNSTMFDWPVLERQMPWVAEAVPDTRRRDTMRQAYAHSLPGALGLLSEVLGVTAEDQKMKEGKAHIKLFCIPTEAGTYNDATSHPTEWAKFIEYAGRDITSMRSAHAKMPKWNYPNNALEMQVAELDTTINRRGLLIDMDLVAGALAAVEKEQKHLARMAHAMTEGDVQAATQRDAMLAHILKEYGVTLPDMKGSTLERRIQDPDLPPALRDLLAVRLQASTSSTAKYKILARATNTDARLRGTLQYCGAARTGRWAGRQFQPQNLPSRGILPNDQIEEGIEALKIGCADLVVDDVMKLTSSAIRGCIVAPPGKKLVVSDLANIEGRVLAYLAGEQWKLDAFRAFDAGTGHDLYKIAYAQAFGIKPEDVNKKQRNEGKPIELGLGFGSGVGGFITFAAAYGVDIEAMAEQAYSTMDDVFLDEAEGFYDWTIKQKRPTFGLSRQAFVVCDAIKRAWRTANPNIVGLWADLGRAIEDAIQQPKRTFEARLLKVQRDGNWLRIRLPSGRSLCYPAPQMVDGQFTYMGVNQYSRKWERIRSYAAKAVENVTQGFARDFLAHGAMLAEQHGYHVVTLVHDEAPTEAPDTDEYTAEGLSRLLATPPAWAPDIPLAAEGFEAYRYKKG